MSSQLLIEASLIGSVFVICGIGWLLFRHSEHNASYVAENVLTSLIGVFLLMAGTVKFFSPFADMFASQVALSGLPFPTLASWAGQLGEMLAGGLFLFLVLARKNVSKSLADRLFFGATALTGIIMAVAVYVHLQPGVPASVLPLQTKPPVLTLIVMALVGFNAWLHYANEQHHTNNNSPIID